MRKQKHEEPNGNKAAGHDGNKEEADKNGKYGKRTLLEATATTGATAADYEGHGPAGCDETSEYCLLVLLQTLLVLVLADAFCCTQSKA
jgi:hypothetical protein